MHEDAHGFGSGSEAMSVARNVSRLSERFVAMAENYLAAVWLAD